ncbi:MAG: hypothetical protein ACRCVK_11430 [Aeromonas veronii]
MSTKPDRPPRSALSRAVRGPWGPVVPYDLIIQPAPPVEHQEPAITHRGPPSPPPTPKPRPKPPAGD